MVGIESVPSVAGFASARLRHSYAQSAYMRQVHSLQGDLAVPSERLKRPLENAPISEISFQVCAFDWQTRQPAPEVDQKIFFRRPAL
jgi:hypothetical protein